MSINIFKNNHKINIKVRDIKQLVKNIIINENKNIGDINIIFVDDDRILEINKQYLNHDYFTDVITFDYSANNIISGDIFISIDTVMSNSIKYKKAFDNELLRVIIHGNLHLVGYNDKSAKDKKIMTEQEDNYLIC